ncbi:hypothetical protein J6590_031363 [Homalodisca vitripennis]|nr:hypothetical protein J6590_031363 [Homalodisca vitripennis]
MELSSRVIARSNIEVRSGVQGNTPQFAQCPSRVQGDRLVADASSRRLRCRNPDQLSLSAV